MKEENFKILQFIREWFVAIEKELDNFPTKDIELNKKIREDSLDILELSYLANTTLDVNVKKDTITRIIAKVKVIDFLINVAYDKKAIGEKKYYKLGLRLGDIAKYSNAWLKNTQGYKS